MKLQPLFRVILVISSSAKAYGECSFGTPVAVVSNGVIVGTTTLLPAATSPVNKFLGIPFSSPPERFSPPAPAASWSQPLNATAFSPACIQQFSYGDSLSQSSSETGGSGLSESEDCLYLNVFQPGGPPPHGGWAVLFWIYGGGFQFGSANEAFYDGSSFAAYEDVLLVSFNYRTNAFGFPGSPELPLNASNLGLLDQRFALQWVQDNIKSFGGNPGKVTIFGESAGAISVDALISAPPLNLPFRAAILESGNIIGADLSALGTNTTKTWFSLVDGLNCSSAVSPLACVRAAPASSIKSFIQRAALSYTAVVDNVTYVSKSTAARASGRAAKIPILVGSNANEGTLFTYGQTNLTEFIGTKFATLPSLQQEIAKAYAVGMPGIATEAEAIAQIFTEVGFQCPVALMANQSTAVGNPTWRYYYNATFPNLSPISGLGVFHSSEIPLVFGTYPTNATAQEAALSQYMRGAWAKFARNPKGGPGWNEVGSFEGSDLGVLGTFGSSGVTIISSAELDVRCPLYARIYSVIGS